MRIKELKLHNFRGIKDLHLEFNLEHNVVVLVGINGIGKSSILECINLSIQYYNRIYEEYVSSGFTERIPLVNLNILESNIHLNTSSTINKIGVKLDNETDVEWEILGFRDYDDDGIEYFSKEVLRKSQENIILNGFEDLTDRYFYCLSNRQVVDLTGTDTSKAKNIIDFKSFSKWFKETEDLENEKRLSEDIEYRHPLLKSVRQAVYSVLGNGYNNLTFKRAIDKIIIKKYDREIALEFLSDGEKNLLAMVGHLSRRLAEEYGSFDNKLGLSGLVLIDEIELHLHPEWQRMIIPRLTKTFPNCQFIVTTHSPQVLSHVAPECIHILDYDGDNVIVKRPESSYGLDSNRILEDILGVSKRPQEIQDRMLELFRTINNNDLASAKEIVRELGDQIGINEPELVKAEATIKRREVIGR
jgi:predicted ATP-binding protein involved in virulence